MSKVYQSVTKRSRRLNVRVFPKAEKYMARRPYVPGQHGNSRRRIKMSDYALQLQEKQRAKFIYGLREKQFRNLFKKASNSEDITGNKLIELLERRLDNIVFRAGFAKTRKHARQLVNHGHFKVNEQKVTIPSYSVKKGDQIEPVKKDKMKIQDLEKVSWISSDKKKKNAKVVSLPSREEAGVDLDEQLIIEFYSR